MTHKFLSEEETVKVLIAAGGGFAAMFTNLDLMLKIVIGCLTIIYLGFKISKEIHERKQRKNGTGQSNP